MQKFEDIINEATRLIDCFTHDWIKRLDLRKDGLSQVLGLLSDQESRDTFCREIMFMAFRNFLDVRLQIVVAPPTIQS